MDEKPLKEMNVRELLGTAEELKISQEETYKRFENENTHEYGNKMDQWLPDFDYIHELLLQTIAPYLEGGGQVADLGGGTGRLAAQILERFQSTHVTVADYSQNMLSEVPKKLAPYKSRYSTREFDLFNDDFDFGEEVFDATTSVMAIHHGQNLNAYRGIYQRIYRWLATPGIFVNLDHVLGDSHELTVLNVEGWKDFLDSHSLPTNGMIRGTYREDTPISLTSHLHLLQEVGFEIIDVLWKKFNFSLYVAVKG